MQKQIIIFAEAQVSGRRGFGYTSFHIAHTHTHEKISFDDITKNFDITRNIASMEPDRIFTVASTTFSGFPNHINESKITKQICCVQVLQPQHQNFKGKNKVAAISCVCDKQCFVTRVCLYKQSCFLYVYLRTKSSLPEMRGEKTLTA